MREKTRGRQRPKLTIPKVLACTVLTVSLASVSCDLQEEHPVFCTSDERDAGANQDGGSVVCPNRFVEREEDCPEGCIAETV